jgi:hypothetical protein
MIDLGTGNNNKMCVFTNSFVFSLTNAVSPLRNWAMDNKQEVRYSLTRKYHLIQPLFKDDRYYRDCLSWSFKGSWSGGLAERYEAS